MPTELHLAEDAFALHLLLQHLESLVDIVVTDENLHLVFLFNSTVDRPDGQRLSSIKLPLILDWFPDVSRGFFSAFDAAPSYWVQ
jgi:hypothetical protein